MCEIDISVAIISISSLYNASYRSWGSDIPLSRRALIQLRSRFVVSFVTLEREREREKERERVREGGGEEGGRQTDRGKETYIYILS